jgi:hypothetical protein
MVVLASTLIAAQLAFAPPAKRGSCLDSAKTVPMNMLPDNSATSDVVRIDTLRSEGPHGTEIVGFIYTLQRGDSWFGAQKTTNMTEEGLAEVGHWLPITARPEALSDEPFDPRDNGYAFYQLNRNWRLTLKAHQLSTVSCVAWPKDEPLPAQG